MTWLFNLRKHMFHGLLVLVGGALWMEVYVIGRGLRGWISCCALSLWEAVLQVEIGEIENSQGDNSWRSWEQLNEPRGEKSEILFLWFFERSQEQLSKPLLNLKEQERARNSLRLPKQHLEKLRNFRRFFKHLEMASNTNTEETASDFWFSEGVAKSGRLGAVSRRVSWRQCLKHVIWSVFPGNWWPWLERRAVRLL